MSGGMLISTEVQVYPVTTRKHRRQFVELPWKLYKDDPNWVPPLRSNQAELLGYKSHPFHEVAEVETFIAQRDGVTVGRIAAILNHSHNKYYETNIGFFGFFESIDDQIVADALFEAARAWFAERGITQLRGPANPSMNYECGLLVEGFDSPPTFMMTYNPPYYAKLVEQAGFEKVHDLLAFIGYIDQLPAVQEKLKPLADMAQERAEATIRPMNQKAFQKDLELFLDLYNRSLGHMWGFVPMTPNEVKALGKSLKYLLIPELSLAAEVKGEGVGVVIGLPDYNPRVKQIDGRLFPMGWWHLLHNKQGLKRIRVLSINVVPEYQRWGLGLSLMRDLVPKILEMGIKEAEFSWVSEANTMACSGLRKGGAKHYKTYRMYDSVR
jgi:GNAT superfamily N-acetyltransferase